MAIEYADERVAIIDISKFKVIKTFLIEGKAKDYIKIFQDQVAVFS